MLSQRRKNNMAYNTNDPLNDPALLKYVTQMQAQQSYNTGLAGVSAGTIGNAYNTAVYGSSTGLKKAVTGIYDTENFHKRAREVNTNTILRGINGLLYKIAEMKGR
jgi:hypothetical protein